MTTFAPRHSLLVFSIVTFILALLVAFCAQPGLNLLFASYPTRTDVLAAVLPTALGGLIGVVYIIYSVVITRWMVVVEGVEEVEEDGMNDAPENDSEEWAEDEFGFWTGPDDWGQPEDEFSAPDPVKRIRRR